MRSSAALRAVVAVGLLVSVLVVGITTASAAGAHPLGNFTTNRYAGIEAGPTAVRIRYVLDEAELVAFRERAALARGTEVFATDRGASIARSLHLSVNGRRQRLVAVDHHLTQPEGQGGLTTLRLEILFEAKLTGLGAPVVDVEFEDRNQPNRLGWREIVARPVAGSRVLVSNVPTKDRTSALTNYPTDPSVTPLDVRRAAFSYVPGGAAEDRGQLDARTRPGAPSSDRFVGLVTRTTSSPVGVLSALLVALAFGGVHALGPGHGKTVMAAYLVSTKGRRRDAVFLGGIVSLMHTASVLALALLLATIGRNLAADRLYPALTVVAGLLVSAVGLRLLSKRLRARRAAAADHHHHGGDGVSHDHEHHHGHGGHSHSHALPADVAPLSRAGLLALGTSGGLFPSPSAVVVLVGAFTVGRSVLGVALIAAFSVGLAIVLVGVGLLLVAGRDRIVRSSFALRIAWLPLAGAGAITLLGAVLLVQGLTDLR